MPRKGKGKVSEEPVVQKANSKNSNNAPLSPTGLALRLSLINMMHNAERNQNPNAGASTNVTTSKPKSSSARKERPMSAKQGERAEKKPKPPPKSSKKKVSLKNFLQNEPVEERIRPNYPFKKPTKLAILVINNDDGKRVRPNTKPGNPGRVWRNKTRHATLDYKKNGKKMTPLLKSNVKDRNPRLVIEGSHNNEFNFSKNSIDRIILELSTRIRQFNVNNPFDTSTQQAATHEQYLMSLIMSAEIARSRATGWRRQVLEDMLAWINSSKGNIFRAGG